jgi:hypothetical protein
LNATPSIAQAGWNTDAAEFAKAVTEFETALPGFWWSVGQCSVGAHASCAVDGRGSQADLLIGVKAGEPLDDGFHCDTTGGSPAEALRSVMQQALAYLETYKAPFADRRARRISVEIDREAQSIAAALDVADRRIEMVARAMCGADGYTADELAPGSVSAPRWYSYFGEARRFIAAQRVLEAAKKVEDLHQ